MFEVRQAMFIRRALEVDMIRALAADIPDSVLSQIEMNLHSQRLAVQKGDPRTFHELDLAFHKILLDCLAYPRATAAIDASRSSLDRARRMLSSPRRHADTLAEHEPIFTSLKNHDTDGATRAMQDHLDAVLAELMALMASRPDVFDHGP
jgi:DNA-binding GntR family transcriptional regulator